MHLVYLRMPSSLNPVWKSIAIFKQSQSGHSNANVSWVWINVLVCRPWNWLKKYVLHPSHAPYQFQGLYIDFYGTTQRHRNKSDGSPPPPLPRAITFRSLLHTQLPPLVTTVHFATVLSDNFQQPYAIWPRWLARDVRRGMQQQAKIGEPLVLPSHGVIKGLLIKPTEVTVLHRLQNFKTCFSLS